ncbi:MAG: alanine racemase [Acidobacteriota bacterium]
MTSGRPDLRNILGLLAGRRATWAEIDLDALRDNLTAVRAHCGDRPIWAVVKADAYGHGASACARTLVSAGASGLVVALPDEGVALRAAGIEAPILIAGALPTGAVDILIDHDLMPALSSVRDLDRFAAAASRRECRPTYHLELDTGMTRMGLSPADLPAFLDAAGRTGRCEMGAVFSHLAGVHDPAGAGARSQLARLQELAGQVVHRLGHAVPCHLAASPAVCAFDEAWLDGIRPGLLLYGVRPDEALTPPAGLRQVLSLRTAVALVRQVPAGRAVGYDGTFVTPSATRIAVLSAGYADGLNRAAAGRAEALLGGNRCPYRGAVNMDLAQVDVGPRTAVEDGSIATLIGTDGEDRITIEELADRTERTPYEWLTGVGARVPRIYIEHHEITGSYTPATYQQPSANDVSAPS